MPEGPTDGPAAVLFDIDGTLVDSNYLHVQTWRTAFADAGVRVDDWRAHRAIGMDGQRLLAELMPDADEATRARAKESHSASYAALADQLRAFPGARALLESCKRRGLLVVLATSAPADELARLRKVLACDDLVDAVTSADDVEDAKPHPGIVQVALDRVGVPPERAVLVGDAVWDGYAAQRAGVAFIGVRSGGVGEAELREAGATEVHADVSALGAHLDDSPVGALAPS